MRRKEKLAEDKITEGEQDNHPIYVLEKITSGESGPGEDYKKKRAVTAENRLRQLEQSVSLREPLLKNSSDTEYVWKEQWNRLFNGDCTVQPYCRQGQHIPLDNPLHMRLEERTQANAP